MKLSNDELNIMLDGLQDTLIRNERGELEKETFNYINDIRILKKRIERELDFPINEIMCPLCKGKGNIGKAVKNKVDKLIPTLEYLTDEGRRLFL